jgi:Holliday junction DNA helicase RuvA
MISIQLPGAVACKMKIRCPPAPMAAGVGLSAKAEAEDLVIEPAPAPTRTVKPDGGASRRAAFSADALSALINLGYGQGDAAQAVATAMGDQPEADTAALIRASLKLLAPR